MSDYFIGEIRLFSFNWAPRNWVLCNGATLQIQQYKALYSLLGVAYGGNGSTTFQVPDFRGRAGLSIGTSPVSGTVYQIGNNGGAEGVALTIASMPAHNHALQATTGTSASPVNPNKGGAIFAQAPLGTNLYAPPSSTTPLNQATLTQTGGNQPHNNVQPFTVLNFCISVLGLYPSRK